MKLTRRRLRLLIREVLNEQGVLDQTLASLPEPPLWLVQPGLALADDAISYYAPDYEGIADIRKKEFLLNPESALDNIRNDKAVQREVDAIVDAIDTYADAAQVGLTAAGIGAIMTPAVAASPALIAGGAAAGGFGSSVKAVTALAKGDKATAGVALAEFFADIAIVASLEKMATDLVFKTGIYDQLVKALASLVKDYEMRHLVSAVTLVTGSTATIQTLLISIGEAMEEMAKKYESAQRDESDEKISVEETKEMARRLMNLVPQIEAQPHPLGPGEDI